MKRLLIAVALFAVACAVVVAAVFMFRDREPARVGLPLARAAEEGDAAAVRRLIAAGANVNERDGGKTPLAYAARSGETEAVKALLDAGAEPDARDCGHWGWTPLINAIHKYRNDAARTLVERGADVNARAGGCAEKSVESGLTPLMMAAKYDNPEAVKLLLEHGADVRATYDGYTVLSYAVAGGSLGKLSDIDRAAAHPCPVETVKLLLEKAPDLGVNGGTLDRATLYLVEKKCPDVARLLEGRKPAPTPAPGARATQASAAPGGARR
ncbi:MAG TPA: ankyrin repeat domain-containing protein [Pyrinomonadaceae bacterium]